jgi:hypothetical protein
MAVSGAFAEEMPNLLRGGYVRIKALDPFGTKFPVPSFLWLSVGKDTHCSQEPQNLTGSSRTEPNIRIERCHRTWRSRLSASSCRARIKTPPAT